MEGGLAADVSGRGHAIRVDEPEEFGGEDTGPMPTELVAAALASCFCVAIVWAARKRASRSATSRCRCSRTGRSASAPRQLRPLGHSSTPAAEIAPAVELAKRYCWVTNTLAHPPEIRYHLDEPIG